MSDDNNTPQHPTSLSINKVLTTWLPLVGSWMLMSIELPTINAIVARLQNPEVNLAAYGGVVFPIALTIEAPVIMLLAASTALSRDWKSYRQLRKFTLLLGGGLSLLHLLVAVTPMYDFVVNVLLQVPPEVVEPGRIGLLVLSPWTLAIAYRRFQQGTMIRFGHSNMVGETTVVRLVTVAVVLTIGMIVKTIPGTLLAGLAQGLGVTFEATYAGLRMRRILPEIKAAPPSTKPLSAKRFLSFYAPLALTSSLWLLWQPLISGAVSRMPDPLGSLAVWSVVTGLLFMFRSPGVAYNEAVVALLEEPQSYPVLKKFARYASLVTTSIAVLVVATPLSRLWFTYVANLSPDNVTIARVALVLGLPLAALSIYISFFQGIIVYQGKTGVIAEATAVFLVSLGAILVTGVLTEAYKGVYVAAAGFAFAHLTQNFWLMLRSRKKRQVLDAEAQF